VTYLGPIGGTNIVFLWIFEYQ